MKLKVKKVDPRAILPAYAHPGDSGFDLRAITEEPIFIPPGERRSIDTGLAFEIPEGYEGQVRPRSGLSFKSGMVTSLGTVDSNFCGTVRVCLYNHSFSTFRVDNGDRIAQMVIAPVQQVQLEEVQEFTKVTSRGENGFGSSGVK